MPRSETLVQEAYFGHPELWQGAWRTEAVRQLALAARQQLTSIFPIGVGAQLARFDTPQTRVTMVSNESSLILERLVASGSVFRAHLVTAFSGSGIGMPSGNQLRAILRPLIAQSLGSFTGSSILVSISEHDIYLELADLLSAELHGIAGHRRRANEPLVLNYAFLIYYFRRWLIPFQRIGEALVEFELGPIGMRGRLISIQNTHRATNNVDDFALPIVPYTAATFDSSIVASSDLLGVIELESQKIPVCNGFFHRAMPISHPLSEDLKAQSVLATQALAEGGRRTIYSQYEHTALLFMSLAGIEFLLRSYCPGNCAQDETLIEVIALYPNMPDPLRAHLANICTTDGWNIRNRCAHGSFLEIEGRREDVIRASGVLSAHGVPTVDLSQDGSLPANVSALVLLKLNELAGHIHSEALTFSNSWTQHFTLTAVELLEASQIHCDIFQSREAAEAWRVSIRDFLQEVTPGISTAVQWGVKSWVADEAPQDAVPGFHFLALLFEPLLRLTLHLGGRPVLQHSEEEGCAVYRVQYLMLDTRGLLDPANIAWLTAHLNVSERRIAERVLALAMKCRNAIAHGAVTRFTNEVRIVYGHVLVKAIQLTVEAGRRQLDEMKMG